MKTINPRKLRKEEKDSQRAYTQLAKHAKREGNTKEAKYLEEIANDERRHKNILARIYHL